MSTLNNFYHHEYWCTDDGMHLLDARRWHQLTLLITQGIENPPSPFISLKGEDRKTYEGWFISWTNFEASFELTIEFDKDEELCIYVMENHEFVFYRSLIYPQFLNRNSDYVMEKESEELTKESLGQAIRDSREWMSKNYHHFAETDQEREEQLHRAFLL